MTNPADLHRALVARLGAFPTVTTYEGVVPPSPPADVSGRVYPYWVVWPAPGSKTPDLRMFTGDASGRLDWTTRVTVAAGTVGWCLEAVDTLRAALEGFRLVPGNTAPLREQDIGAIVQVDTDVSPDRFYLPMMFRAITSN